MRVIADSKGDILSGGCLEHFTNGYGLTGEGEVPKSKPATAPVMHPNGLTILGRINGYGNGGGLGHIALGGYGVGIGDRSSHGEGTYPGPCAHSITGHTGIGGTGHGIGDGEGYANGGIDCWVNHPARGGILESSPSLEGLTCAHGSPAVKDQGERSAHQFNEEGLGTGGAARQARLPGCWAVIGYIATPCNIQSGARYGGNGSVITLIYTANPEDAVAPEVMDDTWCW